jgi:hypothetical protein
MGQRLSDPSWKSGPTRREPTDSEHAIAPEPAGYDIDGVGTSEAERVRGESLCAVREAYSCRREGCDTDPSKSHVYSLTDVSERVQQAARYAISHTDDPTTRDVIEYLATHATVVDYEANPALGFTFGDETFGRVFPQLTTQSGFSGPCYGRNEPSPDVHAYRYDL